MGQGILRTLCATLTRRLALLAALLALASLVNADTLTGRVVGIIPTAVGVPLPDLVCQELRVIQIDPHSLRVQELHGRTLYRFKSRNLYLAPPDRAEYFYNAVVEVEALRYVSGHKNPAI